MGYVAGFVNHNSIPLATVLFFNESSLLTNMLGPTVAFLFYGLVGSAIAQVWIAIAAKLAQLPINVVGPP